MVLSQTYEKDDAVLQFGQGRIIFYVDAFGDIGVYISLIIPEMLEHLLLILILVMQNIFLFL